MVINGGSRGGARELAAHLERTDTNERMEVREMRGLATDNVRDGLRQMEGIAAGTRCQKSLYHANINPGPTEAPLTPEQEARTIDRLEKRLGMEGHPRLVVAHVKSGRAHLHVVWSRIDQATGRAASDSHNYRAHEQVARDLEQEFGHAKVKGAHVREGQPRPPRAPRSAELQQEARTKQNTARIAETVTKLWREAESGQAFAKAMEQHGYALAQGDRRGFCFLDQAGGVHSLSRRIEGATAKEVRARLVGLELESLPSVDQARDQVRERQVIPVQERPAAAEATRRPETEQVRDVPPPKLQPIPTAQPEAQRGDSPRKERPRSAAPRIPSKARDLGRAAGKAAEAGATRAAGGFMGMVIGLLGKAARYADQVSGSKPAREDDQGQEKQPQATPAAVRPAPAQASSPKPRPTPLPPAPPRRSVADELAEQARARGGESKPARAAEPPRERERDRSRFEIRPAIRLKAVFYGEYVGWVAEAKRKLIAYSDRTGESVLAQLEELERIAFRSLYGWPKGPV